jgi:hypothetical protein
MRRKAKQTKYRNITVPLLSEVSVPTEIHVNEADAKIPNIYHPMSNNCVVVG